MTKFFIVVLSCMTLTAGGQTANSSFPNEIKTTRVATHINIPGTRVFIVPPEGFRISSTLPAIEKGEVGLVQAMDLPGGSFYTNAATFSKERFEQKGIKVLEYKELKVNGFPAKLVFMQGDPQTKVYNLIFGDSTFSTMLMGVFASNDDKTGEQVKKALLSIYYDKALKIDPFATAPFKLNDSKSIFKFAKFAASTYLYSIDGIKKDSYQNEPYFMAVALPTQGASLKAIADNMAEMIKDSKFKNVSENKTNGFQSLKREVYGKLNGKPALLFQHIVLIGQSAIVMQGIADDNFDKYIIEFEKLSNTVGKR
jgi:hypothetical protein